MKIEDRVSGYMELLKNEPLKPASPVANTSGEEAAAEATSVAVDISSAAAQLAEDEARRERLEIIRKQLAEGTYNISGKHVADKMLNILKG